MQGIIKTLKNGFGFITPIVADGQMAKDLFFHASGVVGEFNDLREGDQVTFDEVPSERGGMKAANVTKMAANDNGGMAADDQMAA